MIRIIIAFLASVMTGAQTFLIYTRGQAFCLNSGCEIVESLTRVPSLYFNLAGFLYFQLVFWCLVWGRRGSVYSDKVARIFLTAGIVAEAVLVFFQYAIAETFCSYCLIVCACIVLLNIFCGLRQIFRGFILGSTVLVTCFSLQFNVGGAGGQSLDAGSLAHVSGASGRPALYLFFSGTCPHCETVIEALDGENVCEIHFNPIEKLDSFVFPGAQLHPDYDPSINLGFLKNVNLDVVPVLVTMGSEGTQIISGETKIIKYLGENCRENVSIDYSNSSGLSSEIDYTEPLKYMTQEEEGCSIEEDCEKPVK